MKVDKSPLLAVPSPIVRTTSPLSLRSNSPGLALGLDALTISRSPSPMRLTDTPSPETFAALEPFLRMSRDDFMEGTPKERTEVLAKFAQSAGLTQKPTNVTWAQYFETLHASPTGTNEVLGESQHDRAIFSFVTGKLSADRITSNYPTDKIIAYLAIQFDSAAVTLLPAQMIVRLGLSAARINDDAIAAPLRRMPRWPSDVSHETIVTRLQHDPRSIETLPSVHYNDRALLLNLASKDPRFLAFYNGTSLDDPHFVAALQAVNPKAKDCLAHAVAPSKDRPVPEIFVNAVFDYVAKHYAAQGPSYDALCRMTALEQLPAELVIGIIGHLEAENISKVFKAVYETASPKFREYMFKLCGEALELDCPEGRTWTQYLDRLAVTYVGDDLATAVPATMRDRAIAGLLLNKMDPDCALRSFPGDERVATMALRAGADVKNVGKSLHDKVEMFEPLLANGTLKLKAAPTGLRDVEAALLAAICADPRQVKLATPALRLKSNVVVAALSHPQCTAALAHELINALPAALDDDKEIAFWRALYGTPVHGVVSKKILEEPLMQFMLSLQDGEPKFTDNIEVMREATKRRGALLKYGADNVRREITVAIPALQQSSEAWPFIDETLQHNPDVAVHAMGREGQPFLELPEEMQALKRLAFPALSFDPTLAQHLTLELLSEHDIAMFLAQHLDQFPYVAKSRRDESDVVFMAASRGFKALPWIGKRWQSNLEVWRLALAAEPEALKKQDDNVRGYLPLLLSGAAFNLKHVAATLYRNPMVLLAAARRAWNWDSMNPVLEVSTPLQRTLALSVTRQDGALVNNLSGALRKLPAVQMLAAESSMPGGSNTADRDLKWAQGLSAILWEIEVPQDLELDHDFTLMALRAMPTYVRTMPVELRHDETFMERAKRHEPRIEEYL